MPARVCRFGCLPAPHIRCQVSWQTVLQPWPSSCCLKLLKFSRLYASSPDAALLPLLLLLIPAGTTAGSTATNDAAARASAALGTALSVAAATDTRSSRAAIYRSGPRQSTAMNSPPAGWRHDNSSCRLGPVIALLPWLGLPQVVASCHYQCNQRHAHHHLCGVALLLLFGVSQQVVHGFGHVLASLGDRLAGLASSLRERSRSSIAW